MKKKTRDQEAQDLDINQEYLIELMRSVQKSKIIPPRPPKEATEPQEILKNRDTDWEYYQKGALVEISNHNKNIALDLGKSLVAGTLYSSLFLLVLSYWISIPTPVAIILLISLTVSSGICFKAKSLVGNINSIFKYKKYLKEYEYNQKADAVESEYQKAVEYIRALS